MGCGLPAEECIAQHWTELPGAKPVTREGKTHADCPVCGKYRCLSVWPNGRYPSWSLKCKPKCDREEARRKLAALLTQGCISLRYSPRHAAVDHDELVSLFFDKSLTPNALRVAGLQSLGISTAEIREKLGLNRQRWSEVVGVLSRRST